MRNNDTGEKIQRMTVYFPSSLLEKVYKSAKAYKRSFNKQVLWLVENGIMTEENSSKIIVEK